MTGYRGENKPWTKEEEDFLRKNYGHLGVKVCKERLGRSIQSIYARASRLGCTRYFRDEPAPVEIVRPRIGAAHSAVKPSDFISPPTRAQLMRGR